MNDTAMEPTNHYKFSCMVVDDEEHALNQLTRSISQIPLLQLLYAVHNPIEALEILNKQEIDIVFLDVEMPYMNGIEFAKIIGQKTQVILCTAHMHYAVDGFDAAVLDYLLKPVTYPRLIKAVDKAIERIKLLKRPTVNDPNDCFFIKADAKHRSVQVNFADIEYIERVENYSCIYVSGEKKLALQSLTKLMEQLPPGRFIRVHASFIVPVRNIAYIDANELTLKKPVRRIPISAKYKQQVSEMINAGGKM
jgi:two-component system, LytTR family, response regulator